MPTNIKCINVDTRRTIYVTPINGTDFCEYEDEIVMMNLTSNTKDVKVVRGITSVENIAATSNLEPISSTFTIPNTHDPNGTSKVVKISESDLNLVRSGHKHITDAIQVINDSNYHCNDLKPIIFSYATNKIYDLNYNPISLPILINYINGGVDNEYYDLHKLLNILQNDIHVLGKDKLKISNIPYYNATDECNQTIEFLYLMDDELYVKCVNMNNYELWDFILSELIGANKCRL